MAKEYIEREAVLKMLIRSGIISKFAQYRIEQFPAADVVPVVHGRLVSIGHDEMFCEFGTCTVCGADNPMSNRYCSQCGARLDLEG